MSKKCFKCLEIKPLNAFYRHSQMADGHLNKCKKCTKHDTIKNRAEKLDYYQKYDRKRASLPHRIKLRAKIAEKWRSDPKLRKRMNDQKKRWGKKNPIKRAAHIILGNAIKSGKIIKMPCEVCGDSNVQGHHDDYAKPLDVRWLCRKHHAEHHKNIRS